MNSRNFNVKAVEELLKCSKTLQNKIRQELSLQAIESPIVADFRKPEQFSLVWNNVMLSSYGDRIVPHHPHHELSLSTRLNTGKKTPSKAVGSKANSKKMLSKRNCGIKVRDSLLSFHKTSASVGTKVTEKSREKLTSHFSSKRTTTSNLNASRINACKINLESNKLIATSSYRLPLQRFTEPTNKNINFFKDHPDLELDMTSEQTTLFPRRFPKLTDSLFQNVECVNVVGAEVKSPKKTLAVSKQKTWNGILMQNKTSNKPANKILRLKKNKKVIQERAPKILNLAYRPRITEPNGYDLISSIPAKGICTLQTHSERLAKRNKCNRQSFPVLYISPECQVQKLSCVSIRDENESIARATAVGNSKTNVKYFICRHEDESGIGEQTIDLEIFTDGVKIDVKRKDGSNDANKRKQNKALEFRNLYEISTSNIASSPFTRQSSSSNRSFSSLSSSSSLKNVNLSKNINEVHHSFRCPSKCPLSTRITNNLIKSLSSRREVHVQTEIEHKETVSTNTSPLHNPAQPPPQSGVPTSVYINDTLNKIACVHKSENSVEDDIIAEIFEGLRNDLPEALAGYKNRKTSTAIGVTNILPIFSYDEEYSQEQKNQEHANQTPFSNDELNIKLFQNVVEPRLRHVRGEKGEDNFRRTIAQTTPIPGKHKEVLLQQNPLSITKINTSAVSSAMSDVERIMHEKHEYPTDAEIKCAVKIFIDSLSLDGCGGEEKKSIINEISTKRKYMPLPKLDLISSGSLSKYTSSDSSKISNSVNRSNKMVRNVKKIGNTILWSDVSGSSTSTVLSTDLESETDITNDLQSLSLNTNDANKMSDGEIKSIGEI